jgi:hypothetical protein
MELYLHAHNMLSWCAHGFRVSFILTLEVKVKVQVKVEQSHYRFEQALRVPGG